METTSNSESAPSYTSTSDLYPPDQLQSWSLTIDLTTLPTISGPAVEPAT